MRDGDGGRREVRSAEEREFLSLLLERQDVDVRLHEDVDGTPWACVSMDFFGEGHTGDTLRLDFDGTSISGGWSPAFLNWDDGVRASEAGVDTGPPDGIEMTGPPADLAAAASAWFDRHRREWPGSERAKRWRR